jgi:hypothetical protein
MAKKKRLSHDQKRKAKLAKRGRRSAEHGSLAYSGNKYKTPELSYVYHNVETAIYECDVMTNRKLTDRMVASALERLVRQMRQGTLMPPEGTDQLEVREGQEVDLIVTNIRRNLQYLEPRPNHDQMIGVLRTLLGSIELRRTPNPQGRGYLSFIEGFLKQTGVSVQRYSPDGEEDFEPEDEDELLEIGRAWCEDGEPEAEAEFRDLARDMMLSGAAQTVVEVCHRLMGENLDSKTAAELSAIAVEAERAMRTEMG